MRRLILFISMVLILVNWTTAQREPITAQYMLHPTLVNPAAVTMKSGKNGAFIFRKQWAGFEGSPTTMYLNYNALLKNHDNMLGGMIISDKIGVHSNYKIMAVYAHKFRIDRTSYFSLGVSPGFDLFQSDYSQAQSDLESDPILTTQNQTLFSFNSGVGVNYYNNKIWAGFSIPSLFYNRFTGSGDGTAINFSVKELNYQLIAGWKTDIGSHFTFKPSGMVRYQIGAPLQFDINAMFEYKEEIGIGVSYRSLNSMNFMANYRISKDFKLGYAFNMQLGSEINHYHSGTHEVILLYGLGNNRRAKIDLPKKIKKYRKAKMKSIKKALKKAQKKSKSKNSESTYKTQSNSKASTTKEGTVGEKSESGPKKSNAKKSSQTTKRDIKKALKKANKKNDKKSRSKSKQPYS